MTSGSSLLRLALAVAIAGVALWLALSRNALDPAVLGPRSGTSVPWGPVVHIMLFALGTIFVPGALFGLAGGLLFLGLLW